MQKCYDLKTHVLLSRAVAAATQGGSRTTQNTLGLSFKCCLTCASKSGFPETIQRQIRDVSECVLHVCLRDRESEIEKDRGILHLVQSRREKGRKKRRLALHNKSTSTHNKNKSSRGFTDTSSWRGHGPTIMNAECAPVCVCVCVCVWVWVCVRIGFVLTSTLFHRLKLLLCAE